MTCSLSIHCFPLCDSLSSFHALVFAKECYSLNSQGTVIFSSDVSHMSGSLKKILAQSRRNLGSERQRAFHLGNFSKNSPDRITTIMHTGLTANPKGCVSLRHTKMAIDDEIVFWARSGIDQADKSRGTWIEFG